MLSFHILLSHLLLSCLLQVHSVGHPKLEHVLENGFLVDLHHDRAGGGQQREGGGQQKIWVKEEEMVKEEEDNKDMKVKKK